jgi:hypothetical protein
LGVKQRRKGISISFLQLERAIKINDANRSFLEQFYAGQSLKLMEESNFVVDKKAVGLKKRVLGANGSLPVKEKSRQEIKNSPCDDEIEGI